MGALPSEINEISKGGKQKERARNAKLGDVLQILGMCYSNMFLVSRNLAFNRKIEALGDVEELSKAYSKDGMLLDNVQRGLPDLDASIVIRVAFPAIQELSYEKRAGDDCD